MHSSKECIKVQEIDEQILALEYLILRVIAKYRLYHERDYYLQIGRLAIWEALKDFDKARGDIEMYVYMRIKFKIIRELTNQLKVNRNEHMMEDDDLEYLYNNVSEPIQAEERPSWYAYLLDSEKRIIELLYYEGYSMKDAAKVMDISYEVMKKRRKRILEKIRELIEKKTN